MKKRILGIDIGGSSVKMGILNNEGGISETRRVTTITREPEKLADIISAAALEYTPDIVGVGTTGAVNFKTGLVDAGNLLWRGVPLRAMLEERLRIPTWVDNDAKAAMMAEAHSGVCKGTRCAVFITLGTGLGGGLIIDGKPWRGDDNTAFELGHIITRGGEYDSSGKTKAGRFEYYASIMGLERIGDGQTARKIIDEVMLQNAQAMKIYDKFIYELALGLLTVIALFKPEVIALGGGLSAAGDYLLDGIREKVNELCIWRNHRLLTKIHLAVHKNNAGMIGAAALAQLYLVV